MIVCGGSAAPFAPEEALKRNGRIVREQDPQPTDLQKLPQLGLKRAEPAPRLPRVHAPRSDDAPLIALSEALVRARARDAGIAYELIAARAELQAIVASRRSGSNEPDVRTLRGWRRELVGEELLELLSGRVSLSVRDGGVRADARGEAI